MKKSIPRKRLTKCNMKQTDIVAAIKNWISIKRSKDMKKMALYNQVIVIEDSDSESTNLSESLPKKKRPLDLPFSDDEENDKVLSEASHPNKENSLPKKTRPLSKSFSDVEDEESGEKPKDITELSELTPPEHVRPLACSTPIHSSQSFSRHVSINDLSQISQIDRENSNDCSTVSDAESESTIIVGNNSSSPSEGKTIQITRHVIVPSTSKEKNDESVSTSKKRCAEDEKVSKKQKSEHEKVAKSREEESLPKIDDKIAKECDINQNPIIEQDKNQAKSSSEANKEKTVNNLNKWLTKTSGSKESSNGVQSASNKSKSNVKVSKNHSHTNSDDFGTSKITKTSVLGKSLSSTLTSPCTGFRPKKETNTTKKEGKTMNLEPLRLITELFKTVFVSSRKRSLLEKEKRIIRAFLDMGVKYQFVCLKLITRQRIWYNVFKFCNLINLDMEEGDILEMFAVFKRYEIVETEYINDDILSLLQRLDTNDLKSICDKFKLKRTVCTKDKMIKSLLRYSINQCTLTVHKSTKDVLKEEIVRRLGQCVRVNETFQNAFHSTYLLATFANSRFAEMQDYFTNVLRNKIVFPSYPVDDYVIFASSADFLSYAKARQYRDKVEKLTDHLECLQICKTIFVELKALRNDVNEEERFAEAPHLRRFTAKSVYMSTLSIASDFLFCKFPEDVKTWLEYLIKSADSSQRIGKWYNLLVWLYMKYLQPFNYDKAAELLIEVLHLKKKQLSRVQLYQLRARGEQLISAKKYKIQQLNHDLLVKLLPKRIKVEKFPETIVDATTIRSNDLGKKRNYVIRDDEGNKTYLKVEDVALRHYFDELGYTGGEHCEGALVKATFTLFFYDIIYSQTKVVPGTFVSEIQSEPLDMETRYFYENRKEEIDRRLREIENEWSDAEVVRFIERNYEEHSHEFGVCEVGVTVTDPQLLGVLVECVGRRVLAKIYERLVRNYRENRSGLPDLLVWNLEKKESRFVEVKGENDRLSVGQMLWLDYLQEIGAKIEVCHVHSIGSKRKVINKVDSKESAGQSSSTS